LLKCRIRVRLAELEKSQKELAEYMGVSKQTVNGWVTGRVIPPMEKGFIIAEYLKCRVDDLWVLDIINEED
jgi:DNA-binding XRE family transcriptional regulator